MFSVSGDTQINKRIIVYLICVCIASALWFMNALGKSYQTEVFLPVRYTGMPAGKVVTSTLPDTFLLQLNGSGYALLRQHIFFHSPVRVDFSSVTIQQNEQNQYSITAALLSEQISKQLPGGLRVEKIKPDAILLTITEKISKRLPVIPHLQLDFKTTFNISDSIHVFPAFITVYGPQYVLDTMQAVYTVLQNAAEIDDSISFTAALKAPPVWVEYETEQVNIIVPVERMKESIFVLPLIVQNLPPNIALQVIPDSVEITVLVPVSRTDEIEAKMFQANIDYRQTLDNKTGQIPILLDKTPVFVQVQWMLPDRVSYQLIQKND